MKKLQILDLEVIQSEINLTVGEVGQLIKLLLLELATRPNLITVNLSVQCCDNWSQFSESEMPYDAMIIEIFESFESHVKKIIYKGNVIRLT
jgi:hypothetical protein